MSLIEYTIDGKVNKVELALKRIQLGALSQEPLYVRKGRFYNASRYGEKGMFYGMSISNSKLYKDRFEAECEYEMMLEDEE